MTRALRLEDFGRTAAAESAASAPEPAPPPPPPEPDAGGLEAFEQGYKNGWDDCIANENEERRRIGADLAAALQEIEHSAHAVREEMLAGLVPLLEQIASQLLPSVAAEAVAPVVVAELERIASAQLATEAQLVAAPATVPVIENLVAATPELAVDVFPEPAYAEGQVSLRFADQRRDIDLSDAAGRMARAIRDFAAEMVGDGNAAGTAEAPHESIATRGVA
jgi:flagellar assembly protein FliH